MIKFVHSETGAAFSLAVFPLVCLFVLVYNLYKIGKIRSKKLFLFLISALVVISAAVVILLS